MAGAGVEEDALVGRVHFQTKKDLSLFASADNGAIGSLNTHHCVKAASHIILLSLDASAPLS